MKNCYSCGKKFLQENREVNCKRRLCLKERMKNYRIRWEVKRYGSSLEAHRRIDDNRKKRIGEENLKKYRVKVALAWSKKHPERYNSFQVKGRLNYRKKYPERIHAHRVVASAIRKGEIKKLNCQVCGNPKSQAHHEDHLKPLEIVWLCVKHHVLADKERRSRLKREIKLSNK